ncbi:MAG: DUF1425 domain-containing protein [Verrucomicrobiae bacterium]|nr:DUF1425 domain-containing protein [Verrucomicrobiae bacterium]
MKLHSRPILALSLLAVVAFAAGCNTSRHQVNTVEPANPHYVRQPIEDKRILRDRNVSRSVAILTVIEGVTPEGLQRIGVEVQNRRTQSFRFNYRFDWFDLQGFPVNTPTATMISRQIEGGQILVLDSVAPHPHARDFRLTLQESTRDYFPRIRRE